MFTGREKEMLNELGMQAQKDKADSEEKLLALNRRRAEIEKKVNEIKEREKRRCKACRGGM